jgi:hypothetical protein
VIQIKLLYIIIFALGINLVTNWNIEYIFSQTSQLNNSGGGLGTKYLLIHFPLQKNLSLRKRLLQI